MKILNRFLFMILLSLIVVSAVGTVMADGSGSFATVEEFEDEYDDEIGEVDNDTEGNESDAEGTLSQIEEFEDEDDGIVNELYDDSYGGSDESDYSDDVYASSADSDSSQSDSSLSSHATANPILLLLTALLLFGVVSTKHFKK